MNWPLQRALQHWLLLMHRLAPLARAASVNGFEGPQPRDMTQDEFTKQTVQTLNRNTAIDHWMSQCLQKRDFDKSVWQEH